MNEITNGSEALNFLSTFEFWNLTQATSGKLTLVVRDHNKQYVRLQSRKNESLTPMIERMRQKIETGK